MGTNRIELDPHGLEFVSGGTKENMDLFLKSAEEYLRRSMLELGTAQDMSKSMSTLKSYIQFTFKDMGLMTAEEFDIISGSLDEIYMGLLNELA